MRFALSLTAALLLAGGASADPMPHTGPAGIWRVIELDGAPVVPSDEVSLAFEAGRVSGSTGCNRFSGRYALAQGFAFGDLATTRMACPGRRGELEAAFTGAARRINDWRYAEDGTLELLLDDRPLMRARHEG